MLIDMFIFHIDDKQNNDYSEAIDKRIQLIESCNKNGFFKL